MCISQEYTFRVIFFEREIEGLHTSVLFCSGRIINGCLSVNDAIRAHSRSSLSPTGEIQLITIDKWDNMYLLEVLEIPFEYLRKNDVFFLWKHISFEVSAFCNVDGSRSFWLNNKHNRRVTYDSWLRYTLWTVCRKSAIKIGSFFFFLSWIL